MLKTVLRWACSDGKLQVQIIRVAVAASKDSIQTPSSHVSFNFLIHSECVECVILLLTLVSLCMVNCWSVVHGALCLLPHAEIQFYTFCYD